MTTITLPARCDRAAAMALFPEFVAAIGADVLDVDARQAEQVGQAMLQLLASAKSSFALVRIAPSDKLREAARLTGLENVLLDEVAK
ncbi:chemotaxis protein CheX [Alteraurantiacibacter palmitatis]|uniref:Chemotaxis protein CheX n=1 Tax=Alteraurantiacibacter palmitatis TaxID=2054628 RepID=A0ABV7E6N4_9SPHN